MVAKAVQRIVDWDWRDKHIQTLLRSGKLVSSSTTLLAAGPPELGDRAGVSLLGDATFNPDENQDIAYPIGGVDNATMAQQQRVYRLMELGSDKTRMIAGDVFGSITLNRVFYNGPNLLKAIYAYYQRLWTEDFANILRWYEETTRGNFVDASPRLAVSQELKDRLPEIKVPPGYENFFIDLASDLFKQPTGLMLLIRDNTGTYYGAVYMENCLVSYHGITFPRGAVLIMEQARIEFARARGVQLFARVPATSTYAVPGTLV